MDDLTSEALNAEGETGEVEFKETFDTSSTGAWCEIIKDIIAIANSGGGVIVFGFDDNGNPSGEDVQDVSDLDPAKISDKITKYTDVQFSEFRIYEREVEGEVVVALRIDRSNIPMVFTSPGNYPVGDGRQKTAFSSGTVYFRHGAKSEPGTQDDIREAVRREVEALRDSWLSNIRRVVEAPVGSQVVLVPPEEVDSDESLQMPIRVVTDDPDAPEYRKVDPDVTHPYRMKEVVKEVNDRIDDHEINRHDIISINNVYNTKEREELCHTPRYGNPQYSTAFVERIVERYEANRDFFEEVREEYYEMRYD